MRALVVALLLSVLVSALVCVADARPSSSSATAPVPPIPRDTPSIYNSLRGKPYTVGFDSRALLIEGERVLLQSGSIHYPRAPPEMWPHLFQLARQHGINMLETYVFWDWHAPSPNVMDFSSYGRNLSQFIQQAGGQSAAADNRAMLLPLQRHLLIFLSATSLCCGSSM